jgi:hypothetical protein
MLAVGSGSGFHPPPTHPRCALDRTSLWSLRLALWPECAAGSVSSVRLADAARQRRRLLGSSLSLAACLVPHSPTLPPTLSRSDSLSLSYSQTLRGHSPLSPCSLSLRHNNSLKHTHSLTHASCWQGAWRCWTPPPGRCASRQRGTSVRPSASRCPPTEAWCDLDTLHLV